MAYNLKPKPFPLSTEYPRTEDIAVKRSEIRLTFGQMLTFWGIISGMMVVVFFFGLHAGMEQGLRKALDEQDAAVVRLPILPNAAPIAGSNGHEAPPPIGMQAPVIAPSAGTEDKFDFSGMVLPSSPTGSVVAYPPSSTEPAAVPSRVSSQENLTVERPKTEQPTRVAPAEVAAIAPKPTAPKPRAVVTTKPVTQSPTTRIPRGHYVQVAAPATRSDAQSVISRLNSSGISAVVQETRVNGVLYYRVLAGPTKSRDSADTLRAKILKSGTRSESAFVRYIE